MGLVVSIQLVSPASGDDLHWGKIILHDDVSIQLVSPASGDINKWLNHLVQARKLSKFPFN